MNLLPLSPKKALKAFLKKKPLRNQIDLFKQNLIALLDKTSITEQQPRDESEEHLKNNLRDFLRDTYYKDTHAINTKDKKDLVIHLNKTTASDVGVIIEAKRPSNITEMIAAANPNRKALHELVLYYMNERHQAGNNQLKQLIITSIYEWYIVDANFFDKYIYRNPLLRKLYETKLNDKKDNPWFYEEVSKIISQLDIEIPCIYFDIRDVETKLRNPNKEDDRELIALYKILSPEHLLKIATPEDSNSLDEKFYKELLHIYGLEEVKNIIGRKTGDRNPASFIELTIDALKTEDSFHRVTDIGADGADKEEQIFNVALELCITWINRILFLKLLEGQLLNYHQDNSSYSFLNFDTINDFDELFKLFHKVLAVDIPDRSDAVKDKYKFVPYLNSSLFEISDLEDQAIKINSLANDGMLALMNNTVLKEVRQRVVKLSPLEYLFRFLDAYDFSSEGTEDIQENNKTLINASVLGKVFEKINGYKDGSIFTPGYITMYMCRQSIRKTVVDKFNEAVSEKGKRLFDKFDDVKNYTARLYKTEEVLRANEIVNSIRICDPAVGSGHFLVSALNEIIAIKSELGILADEKGNNIAGYEIEIVNDELIITDMDGDIVEYKIRNNKPVTKEIQRLFKALFHEKQLVIENCLFGVDVNAKSVLICRLRLWIELLKNAYYKEPGFAELETLPNIDINIRCGNSLLNRFRLDADLGKALKSIKYDIKAYRGFVNDYKNEKSREVKRGLQKIINGIKGDFKTEITKNDPKVIRLNRLNGDLYFLNNQTVLHAENASQKKAKAEKKEKLQKEIDKLERDLDEIKNNAIYKNAFEWRFEFPEVLTNTGDFEGFDVIIANPPYVFARENFTPQLKKYYSEHYDTSQYQVNLFLLFVDRTIALLKPGGVFSLIIPNSFLMIESAQKIRRHLLENTALSEIINLMGNTFEGVNVETIIISGAREKQKDYSNKIAIYINEGSDFVLSQWKEQQIFIRNEGAELTVFSDAEGDDIRRKMNTHAEILDEVAIVRSGLKAYEAGKGIPKQTPEDVVARPYDFKEKADSDTHKYLEGKDVGRYEIKWSGTWLRYGDHLAAPRTFDLFSGEKIIIREITGKHPRSINAAYASEVFLFNMSNIVILEKEGSKVNLKYLLALLNSKLFSYYFLKNTAKSVRKLFPKLIIKDLRKFPIRIIDKKEQGPFIDLVDQILAERQHGRTTTHLENALDDLVYGIYGITESERKIIGSGEL